MDLTQIRASDIMRNSRSTINDNFAALASDFASDQFPDAPSVGMVCYRTDKQIAYRYMGDNIWRVEADYSSGNAVVTEATSATFDSEGRDISKTYVKNTDVFKGATSSNAGTAGIVPQPLNTDYNKALYGDGTWKEVPTYMQRGEILEMIYPIGSIYLSALSTSPKVLFGFGEWVALPTGRTMVFAGSNFAALSTGGSETMTLTTNHIPSHGHGASISTTSLVGRFRSRSNSYYGKEATTPIMKGAADGIVSVAQSGLRSEGNSDDNRTEYIAKIDASHKHTITINNTGGGKSFSLMQPWIAVYAWRRVG